MASLVRLPRSPQLLRSAQESPDTFEEGVGPSSYMMRAYQLIPFLSLLSIVGCDQSTKQSKEVEAGVTQRFEIKLERQGMITVHHPGDVPPVSIFWEEDGFFLNHDLGKEGSLINPFGNTVKVWLKGQEHGQFRVRRNNSDGEIKARVEAGEPQGDISTYVDQNGDGIVDYRRNGNGVYRVAKIVWEKVADLPAVPPEEPSQRDDVDVNPSATKSID